MARKTEEELQALIDDIDTALAAIVTNDAEDVKLGPLAIAQKTGDRVKSLQDLRQAYIDEMNSIPNAQTTVFDDPAI